LIPRKGEGKRGEKGLGGKMNEKKKKKKKGRKGHLLICQCGAKSFVNSRGDQVTGSARG